MSNELDVTGKSIGKRYARADEVGIPFVITVDLDEGVTIRERDSKHQVRIPDDEVVDVVRDLANGLVMWEGVTRKYDHSMNPTLEWILRICRCFG